LEEFCCNAALLLRRSIDANRRSNRQGFLGTVEEHGRDDRLAQPGNHSYSSFSPNLVLPRGRLRAFGSVSESAWA
jgi:hypothetical protein